jgi:methyl-accepting chemotaxis protein
MKDWSISRRIAFGFVLLLFGLVVLSGLSIYNMQNVVRTESMNSQMLVPADELATGFEREILNARIFFIYHVTIQKPGVLDKGWERFHNAQARQQELQTLVDQHQELGSLRPVVAKMKDDLDVYSVSLQATLAMVQSGVTHGSGYDAQVKDWAAKGAVVVGDAGTLEALCSNKEVAATTTMLSGLKSAALIFLLLFVAAVLLSAMLAWSTVRKVNGVLQGSVLELNEASTQIASAARQVSSSSQSLAESASEHASMFQETSNASTEINSISFQTTENTRVAAEKMTRSDETLKETNQSLTQMVDAMERINGSSQKISKIIKVIDEIAFQTNILALNAAVEAARAGEAGLGFAVVADEVRNLAQRCAGAARDTTELIEESITNTREGKTKVDQVAVAIRTITSESATIKDLIDEISVGSVEQSHGIDQISKSILQMEQVTQSSAASAEESAAAAEQLNAQADAMKEIVERLRAMVDGGSDSSGGGRVAVPQLHLSGAEPLAESGI